MKSKNEHFVLILVIHNSTQANVPVLCLLLHMAYMNKCGLTCGDESQVGLIDGSTKLLVLLQMIMEVNCHSFFFLFCCRGNHS